MNIFELTKAFPSEEKWTLISQIRRSSRSVCSNLGEGYRKRIYENHFISKISDADMENTETQVWFDFALACNYINKDKFDELNLLSEEIGRLLNHMIQNPDKYLSSNTGKLAKEELAVGKIKIKKMIEKYLTEPKVDLNCTN